MFNNRYLGSNKILWSSFSHVENADTYQQIVSNSKQVIQGVVPTQKNRISSQLFEASLSCHAQKNKIQNSKRFQELQKALLASKSLGDKGQQ